MSMILSSFSFSFSFPSSSLTTLELSVVCSTLVGGIGFFQYMYPYTSQKIIQTLINRIRPYLIPFTLQIIRGYSSLQLYIQQLSWYQSYQTNQLQKQKQDKCTIDIIQNHCITNTHILYPFIQEKEDFRIFSIYSKQKTQQTWRIPYTNYLPNEWNTREPCTFRFLSIILSIEEKEKEKETETEKVTEKEPETEPEKDNEKENNENNEYDIVLEDEEGTFYISQNQITYSVWLYLLKKQHHITLSSKQTCYITLLHDDMKIVSFDPSKCIVSFDENDYKLV